MWTPRADVVTLDPKKSAIVFRAIIKAWEEGAKDFGKYEPPERKLKPANIISGTREDGIWRFACGYWSRSGQTADQAIGSVAYFAENHFDLLDPATDPKLEKFQEIMLPRFPFQAEERARRLSMWLACRQSLREKYDCDPRNIFLGVDCADHAHARQLILHRLAGSDFPGIGHKIAQLIAQWFQEVDWPDNKEFWQEFQAIPFTAVDIWLMRLVYQLELVIHYKSEHRDMISLPLSDQIAAICREEKLDHRALVQALWHIGARICATARRKKESARGAFCYLHCPASAYCQSIVPANEIKEGRGEVCWSLAKPRLVLPLE